jgi:hypothetical protein
MVAHESHQDGDHDHIQPGDESRISRRSIEHAAVWVTSPPGKQPQYQRRFEKRPQIPFLVELLYRGNSQGSSTSEAKKNRMASNSYKGIWLTSHFIGIKLLPQITVASTRNPAALRGLTGCHSHLQSIGS